MDPMGQQARLFDFNTLPQRAEGTGREPMTRSVFFRRSSRMFVSAVPSIGLHLQLPWVSSRAQRAPAHRRRGGPEVRRSRTHACALAVRAVIAASSAELYFAMSKTSAARGFRSLC